MIKWVSADRLEVENVAVLPLNVPLPSTTGCILHGAGEQVSSENTTVPVAVEGETVAVNVTDCPNIDGLRLDVRAVVVGIVLTVCTLVADDVRYTLSPL